MMMKMDGKKSGRAGGNAGRLVAGMLAWLVFAILAMPGDADAWWNAKWQFRKKINIDTALSGADLQENIVDFPVLLRMHSGNFDFTRCKLDGSDIRFIGPDDQTALKYHVEKIDTIDEIGLVWVKVPRMPAGADQNFIWMYYGNPEAPGAADSAGTYDINQVVVYHLDERDGTPQDGSAYQNNAGAYSAGQGFPSIIGEGATLNGVSDRIEIPPAPSLDWTAGLTMSAWIKIAMPQQDSVLFSRKTGSGNISLNINGTTLYAQITEGETSKATERTTELTVGEWHQVAMTVTPAGRIGVFLDGLELTWAETGIGLSGADTGLTIGASADGSRFFGGDLDEVRLSKIPRSPAWVWGQFTNQRPDSTMIGIGFEEVGEGESGLPVFYLGTVARNITLDGWVIIGILVFLAVLSWIVFIGKAVVLALTAKDNRAFMSAYEQAQSPYDVGDEDADYPNSSLYRVYRTGCGEMRDYMGIERLSAGNGCSPKALSALKGGLEKAYVRETQRFNAWLVILTITISGGPFLGLLGTVWGVMNTFAAMAEAGEANLTAIAPGVASALATTVFGLLVAIPALFSYNYLCTKIKTMTVNMAVFVDELAMKTELSQKDAP